MKKHLVVTGAAGGVGRQVVRALRDEWDVIATVRSEADLEALQGDGVRAVILDVREPDSFGELRDLISDQALSGLIHAAAVAHTGPAVNTSREHWEVMMEANVIGPALLTAALIDNLREGHGTVVFVNSGAGERGVPLHAAYAASKHALRGYANTLRMEESQHGVRVASVYPGQINTKMLRGINAEMGVPFETERYIDARTVADVIRYILDAPEDVHITNVDVRPRAELSSSFNV